MIWLRDREPARLRLWLTLMSGAQAAVIVAQAALLAALIHALVIEARGLATLAWPMIGLAVIFLARGALESLRAYLAANAAARVQAALRPALYRRIAESGPGVAARTGTGSLATTIIEQVDLLERWYGRFLPLSNAASAIVPLLLLAVLWTDWIAGLFLALAAPLIPLFMVLVGWGAEQASQNQQRELVRLGGVFLDRLRGLDTIRRFGTESFEIARLSDQIESFRSRTLAVLKIAFLSTAVLEFFSAVAIAAVAIYVGLGLLDYINFGPAPNLTLGTGLFILLLAPEFFLPLRQLSQAWHDRADGLAAARSIRTVLDTPPARPEPGVPAELTPSSAYRIEVRDLSLSRPGRGAILSGLDFSVEAGERILIRGPSGGGKSTLLDLLAGFDKADNGTILIAGVALDDLSGSELSRHRAWMGQQGGLFNGTLADNLRLASPAAGNPELIESLSLAGLQDWYGTLNRGLETSVQASGEGLSGGQARRVLLARALLRPRGLLLLDEPTASLDSSTADRLWRTLEQLSRNRRPTIFCASHDPGAERWADRIFTLEGGRIRETQA